MSTLTWSTFPLHISPHISRDIYEHGSKECVKFFVYFTGYEGIIRNKSLIGASPEMIFVYIKLIFIYVHIPKLIRN